MRTAFYKLLKTLYLFSTKNALFTNSYLLTLNYPSKQKPPPRGEGSYPYSRLQIYWIRRLFSIDSYVGRNFEKSRSGDTNTRYSKLPSPRCTVTSQSRSFAG